jgi:hypothetical protein
MERLRLVWGSGCFLGVAIDEDGSIAIQPSEWFDNDLMDDTLDGMLSLFAVVYNE